MDISIPILWLGATVLEAVLKIWGSELPLPPPLPRKKITKIFELKALKRLFVVFFLISFFLHIPCNTEDEFRLFFLRTHFSSDQPRIRSLQRNVKELVIHINDRKL